MDNFSDFLLNKVSGIMMKRSMRVGDFQESPEISAPSNPLLLYIHIPFCEELCPYCSFFKVKFNEDLASKYFEALEKEILSYHSRGFVFDELYIGGGTPTVMPLNLAKIIKLIRDIWPVREVSVETNPNHLQPDILKILKESGVNRLSVGVQTFDDDLLKKMKRFKKYGSGNEIKERILKAQSIFDTLNIDMIFNFPNQTKAMLEFDVTTIKEMKVDQVTFYPLMSSSSVKDRMTRILGTYGSGNEKSYYKYISRQLSENYYPSTAWCFTRRGNMIDEYIVNRDHYIGIGAGSFTYISTGMYASVFSIQDYIDLISLGKTPFTRGNLFSKKEKLLYSLLMSLFGGKIDMGSMKSLYGKFWYIHLFPELTFLLMTRGIVLKGYSFEVTEKGRYFAVALMRDFFTKVNNIREQCYRLA